MDIKDKPKTAFTTDTVLYQFKVIPLGLTKSPPTFQRLMMRFIERTEYLVYLDDVIVIVNSFKEC